MRTNPTIPYGSIEAAAQILERVSHWLTNAPHHVIEDLDDYLAAGGDNSDGLIDALDYNAYEAEQVQTDAQAEGSRAEVAELVRGMQEPLFDGHCDQHDPGDDRQVAEREQVPGKVSPSAGVGSVTRRRSAAGWIKSE